MPKGYLALVLHAHLPFVRHPEEDYFLEENWLYEAINETYLPLLQVFEGLVRDGVGFRITMSLTPPLINMLRDPLLQDRYIRHLDKLIDLSVKEMDRTKYEPHYHHLAVMYHERFCHFKKLFVNAYERDLIGAFKKFQELGCLEIITCCATHGFLPILNLTPKVAEAQIRIAVDHYQDVFGRKPSGIWLPECGFAPGIDEMLKQVGIRYFFVDSHGIINADPRPRYSVYAPVYTPNGIAVFARDWESSKQVWSAEEGYPGHPDYREYYRDIGHELDYDYIRPYIHPSGFRINTGIKYWRITGKPDYKEAYDPHWAKERAAHHAGNFMFNRECQIDHLSHHFDRKPLVIAPYDAELYGHWWFEGPMFLDILFRKIYYDQDNIKTITPSEYLVEYPTNQMAMPSTSSWGYKGYSQYWVDGSNDWIYRHIHQAGKRMISLVKRFKKHLEKGGDPLIRRALNQAGRELLLAESSDWPFIMKSGTMVPYANRRIRLHIARFTHLYEALENNDFDKDWLSEVEWRDNIFSDMDIARYYI